MRIPKWHYLVMDRFFIIFENHSCLPDVALMIPLSSFYPVDPLRIWKKTRHNCKCYNDAFRCIFICTKDIRKIKSLFSRASAKKSQLLTWLLLKLKRDQQSNILYKIHHLQTVQNIGNILGFLLFVVVSIWGGKRHIKEGEKVRRGAEVHQQNYINTPTIDTKSLL